MTINILFLTITINKRKMSLEEFSNKKMVNQLIEDNRSRQAMIRPF